MKRIILPVDFSKHSEYSLEVAAALAKKHNSELIVMHMLELSESIFTATNSDKSEETAFMFMLANKKFNAFLDKPFLEGISVKPMIKHHKVLKEVDEVAKDINADLIIMGSRGENVDFSFFTGSNTEKIIRYSDTPVLVVKSRLENVNFKSIVLALNFETESIAATKKAVKLLSELGSDIHLLHVNLPGTGFLRTPARKEKVNTFLKSADLEHLKDKVVYISDYSVEDGVLSHAEGIDASAIAMVTHGRTGLSHFFEGSISEDLVSSAERPVFTFKQ
ncbi:universal stress protein [Winogradskyella sp. A3E31]|uniref:universal stress protein n=1 Tax=Winogradskyella sp. A3E31 TaxID=3349637 RepID=UPI00398AAED3